ncbi:unnamed protein product [Arabis nemorensis]|uniref:Uncharacterized protein n=1 Tax=Arabis nemorensis TaxID=586526 RepID=A0A565BSN1_9BRAS|nr:unnamed protein product [Arabis nemorensis]
MSTKSSHFSPSSALAIPEFAGPSSKNLWPSREVQILHPVRFQRFKSSIIDAPTPSFTGRDPPSLHHLPFCPTNFEMDQICNIQYLGFASPLLLKGLPHNVTHLIRFDKSIQLEEYFADLGFEVLPTYRRIFDLAATVLEYCQLTGISLNSPLYFTENVFKRSAFTALRVISVVCSPLMAEELQITFKTINLEAPLKKLPVFICGGRIS